MTTKEAIERLDAMQSQIIHGKNTFGEIADVIRKLEDDIRGMVPLCVADQHRLDCVSMSLDLDKITANGGDLYDAACSLMKRRYVDNADQWQNLENAARRFNASRQAPNDPN